MYDRYVHAMYDRLCMISEGKLKKLVNFTSTFYKQRVKAHITPSFFIRFQKNTLHLRRPRTIHRAPTKYCFTRFFGIHIFGAYFARGAIPAPKVLGLRKPEKNWLAELA